MGNCSPCKDASSPEYKNPKFSNYPNPNQQKSNSPPKYRTINFVNHFEEMPNNNIITNPQDQQIKNSNLENKQQIPSETTSNIPLKPNPSMNNHNLPPSNLSHSNMNPEDRHQVFI